MCVRVFCIPEVIYKKCLDLFNLAVKGCNDDNYLNIYIYKPKDQIKHFL